MLGAIHEQNLDRTVHHPPAHGTGGEIVTEGYLNAGLTGVKQMSTIVGEQLEVAFGLRGVRLHRDETGPRKLGRNVKYREFACRECAH